jgi:hypothetical protein
MAENSGYGITLRLQLDSKSSKDFLSSIKPELSNDYRISAKGNAVEIRFSAREACDFEAKCASLSKYIKLFEKSARLAKE